MMVILRPPDVFVRENLETLGAFAKERTTRH